MAVIALAGCTTSAGNGSDDVTTGDSAPPTPSNVERDPLQIDLPGQTPLQSYFATPEQEASIGQAQDILTARCMKKFGYQYAVPDYSDRVKKAKASADQAGSRLYGVTDIAAARKYGLGVDVSGSRSEESEEQAEPSDAYYFVLLGSKGGPVAPQEGAPSPGEVDGIPIPAGGCLGDARKQVTGSVRGVAEEVGQDLWIQTSFRAQSDPKYSTVVDDYRACMSKSGYNVTAILDDKGDTQKFLRDLETTEPSRAEIDFAIALVQCKKKVDLVPRLHAIDSDYAAKAIDDNQLALDEDKSRIDAAVKKAANLVSQRAD